MMFFMTMAAKNGTDAAAVKARSSDVLNKQWLWALRPLER